MVNVSQVTGLFGGGACLRKVAGACRGVLAARRHPRRWGRGPHRHRGGCRSEAEAGPGAMSEDAGEDLGADEAADLASVGEVPLALGADERQEGAGHVLHRGLGEAVARHAGVGGFEQALSHGQVHTGDDRAVDRATVDVYEEKAATYAARRPPKHRARAARFAEAVPPGRPVIDMGCGPGGYLPDLHARGAPVVALDAARAMLDLARAAAPAAMPVRADIAALPFR